MGTPLMIFIIADLLSALHVPTDASPLPSAEFDAANRNNVLEVVLGTEDLGEVSPHSSAILL